MFGNAYFSASSPKHCLSYFDFTVTEPDWLNAAAISPLAEPDWLHW